MMGKIFTKVRKNSVERKESFRKVVLDKNLGYDSIREVINEIKD